METGEAVEKAERAQLLQDDVLADAEDATAQDHDLTLLQAIKLYPKAVGWSVVLSTALVMDGFDTKLMASLFAQPAFAKRYGKLQHNGSYQIPAPWQSGLNNGSNVGQLLGLSISGWLTDKLGFRKTMMIGLLAVPCLIFIQFFAPSLGVLETGQVLLGIPLGLFQTATCVYAVEVMPTCLRAYLTSYVNACWVFGQLIASGMLRGCLNLSAPWAYRIPFATQWVWPLPLLVGVYLAPESPWWFVRKNRLEDAKASIRRLTYHQELNFDVDKNVTLMVITTEHEREANASTSYAACFRGTDLRRTIIVMGCYIMQVMSGSTFRAYSTYFFQQAGLPTDQAFNMSIVTYSLALGGVIVAWFLLPHVGRRTLFLYGLTALSTLFCIVGGLGIRQAATPSSGLAWTIGGILLVNVFISGVTTSPVSYAFVSEIPSSILRSKSVVIARFSYACVNIAANVITPYQLNPSAWGWGARSGWFWGGASFLGLVFTYFFVPEPKDRTIAELDLLFQRKLPARKFASAEVNICEVSGVTRARKNS